MAEGRKAPFGKGQRVVIKAPVRFRLVGAWLVAYAGKEGTVVRCSGQRRRDADGKLQVAYDHVRVRFAVASQVFPLAWVAAVEDPAKTEVTDDSN